MAIPAVVNMAILVQKLTFELDIKLFWGLADGHKITWQVLTSQPESTY